MDVNISNDELYHYGRKGMKWYQNIFTAGKKAAAARKRKKNLAKAREAKKTKKEEKEEVLKSRSAKKLFERADLFTDKELQAAYNRLILEKSIKSLAPDEVSKGEAYAKKFIKTSDTINGVLKSGSSLYDTVAKIVNGITGEKALPIIDADSRQKDANARKAEFEAENVKKPKKKEPEDPDVRRLRKAQADKAEAEAQSAKYKAERDKPKDESSSNTSKSNKDDSRNNTSKSNERETVTGTILGGGNRKNNQSSSTKQKSGYIYDAVWEEASTTSYSSYTRNNAGAISAGQSYVAGLLGSPNIAGLLEAPKQK